MGLIKGTSGFELALGIIIGGSFTMATLIYLEEGISELFNLWVGITVIFVGIAFVLWIYGLFTSYASDSHQYDEDVPDFTTQISPEKRKHEDW